MRCPITPQGWCPPPNGHEGSNHCLVVIKPHLPLAEVEDIWEPEHPLLFSSNRLQLKSQVEKGNPPPQSEVMGWHSHFLCWDGAWAHHLNPSLRKDLGSHIIVTKSEDFNNNKKITHHTKNQEDFNLHEKRQPIDAKIMTGMIELARQNYQSSHHKMLQWVIMKCMK